MARGRNQIPEGLEQGFPLRRYRRGCDWIRGQVKTTREGRDQTALALSMSPRPRQSDGRPVAIVSCSCRQLQGYSDFESSEPRGLVRDAWLYSPDWERSLSRRASAHPPGSASVAMAILIRSPGMNISIPWTSAVHKSPKKAASQTTPKA